MLRPGVGKFLVGAAILLILLPCGLLIFIGGAQQAQQQACTPDGVLYDPVSTNAGQSPDFKEAEQIKHAKMIIGIGLSRKLSKRDIKIALMVAMQESNLRNLPYGDRDSLGIYQQRPSQGWGTTEQIMNPVYAINKFYDALEKVKNRTNMSLFEVAIEVQRPNREAYASRWGLFDKPSDKFLEGVSSKDEVDSVNVALPEAGCTDSLGDVEIAVQAALTQVGKPYRWSKTSSDRGFDASELSQWAYKQAGTTLPDSAAKQFKSGPAVKKPGKGTENEWLDVLRRGDLLFWSDTNKAKPSLVSIYIGSGEMIIATSPNAEVEVVDFRKINSLGRLIGATRPIDDTKNSQADGGKHDGWRWPLKSTEITSPFGMRFHPALGIYRLHDGTDFAAAVGTPVYAAHSGTVTFVGTWSGGGNVVTIDHGGGVETSFLHLDSYSVKQGDKVSAGQQVALSGNTGLSTGPHLHFMLHVDGKGTDPVVYLKQFGLVP